MRTTLYQINGKQYFIEHSRLSDRLGVESKAMVWHVWTSLDYVGNFPTQKEAIKYLQSLKE